MTFKYVINLTDKYWQPDKTAIFSCKTSPTWTRTSVSITTVSSQGCLMKIGVVVVLLILFSPWDVHECVCVWLGAGGGYLVLEPAGQMQAEKVLASQTG